MKAMKKRFLAVFMALILSLTPAAAVSFADTDGHWSASSVERWADAGVLTGAGAGSFLPDKEMTRAEFAQMLCNLMGYTEKAPNTFADIPNGAWYADAMLRLNAAGVMSGVGNHMAAPNDPINREQAAVLLCRAMSIRPSSDAGIAFRDAGSVSGWARDAVAALAQRGMVSGMGGNTFAPDVNINRASVAAMVDNMVAEYVTEDGATITGEVDGVVIIKASNVTVEDAALREPLIVAPAAAEASVTLTGSTQAAEVVMAAQGARLTVDKSVRVDTVAVEASGASAEVAGEVDSVTVAENARNASVTAAPGAAIASIEIRGDNTTVTAQAGAAVSAVEISAAGTTVAGSGRVENVTAEAGASKTAIMTSGTTVENNSSDTVFTGGGSGSSDSGGSTGGSGSGNPGSSGGSTGRPDGDTGSSDGSAGRPDGDTGTVYGVTVIQPENGFITASPVSAAPGTAVTLTCTAKDGFRVSRVTAAQRDGTLVFDDRDFGLSGTFLMPAAGVTVTAEITAVKYAVALDGQSRENGARLVIGSDETPVEEGAAAVGQPVTVQFAVPEGKTAAVTRCGTDGSNTTEIEPVNGVYRFEMPGCDVCVSVQFTDIEEKPADCAVYVDGDTQYGVVLADRDSAAPGETVTVTAVSEEGCELSGLQVTDADNNEIEVNAAEDGIFTFTMPDRDVIVSFVFEKNGYSIRTAEVNANDGIYFYSGDNEGDVRTAREGDMVAIAIPEGREVDSVFYTAEGDGTEIPVEDYGDGYIFEMPAANVTVTVAFRP